MKVKKYVVEVSKGEWGVHTDWVDTKFKNINKANNFALASLWAGNAVRMYVNVVFKKE
jgi:hypothetical protein